MPIYVAKEPLATDPEENPEPPVPTIDPDLDDNGDPVVVDPPPPGWSGTPPSYGLLWAQKTSSTYSMPTVRKWLNDTKIATIYAEGASALYVEESTITDLAVETGGYWYPVETGGFAESQRDDWKDFSGSGTFDTYINGNRKIQLKNLAVFNTTLVNRTAADTTDRAAMDAGSNIINDIVFGDNALMVDGNGSINSTSLVVDPEETQSFDSNRAGSDAAVSFGDYEAYHNISVNSSGNAIKFGDGEASITDVKGMFTRGTYPNADKLLGNNYVTNVITGTDGNPYVYIGIEFKIEHSTPAEQPDVGTLRVMLNRSTDAAGNYQPASEPMFEEEWFIGGGDAVSNKDRELCIGVWLRADTFNEEQVRFKIEYEFDVGGKTAFIEDYTNTYTILNGIEGSPLVNATRAGRLGIFLGEAFNQEDDPYYSIKLKYNHIGGGISIGATYGLPSQGTAASKPLWSDVLTYTTLDYLTTGTDQEITLVEGTFVKPDTGTITSGQKYIIVRADPNADFENVGAGGNTLGYGWTATGTTPTNWGYTWLLHVTTDIIGYTDFVAAAKGYSLNSLIIWVVNKEDADGTTSSLSFNVTSNIDLEVNGTDLSFDTENQYAVAIKRHLTDSDQTVFFYGLMKLEG